MENKKAGRRKGVFFTLAIVLLLIPLIFLVYFYVGLSQTKMEDTTAKIRCDEMHYFVEDVKKDLGRAVVIFGRRAAIYSLDHVVKVPGNPLGDYRFKCSDSCNVDCEKLIYPETGAEAALAELTLCGTLNNTNVTYMLNHTIREWVNRIEVRARDNNFRINTTLREIQVVPKDAWHFSIILDNNIEVIDETGICYYRGYSLRTLSNTSIIGLEDPLYTLSTEGAIIKYIYDCDILKNITRLAGNGTIGDGTGSGRVLLYSSIGSADGMADYCEDTPAEDLLDLILVMDIGGGVSCNRPQLAACVDINSSSHLGGIVNEGPNTLNCNITIPYISGTDDMDLEQSDCVYLENTGSTHHVISGIDCNDINYSCYTTSNISTSEPGCSENHPRGPSFFDRLDGTSNLSEKYVNQSIEHFNNEYIGIETIIDFYELVDHNIAPYGNATWIDYLYWNQVNGSSACGICCEGIPSVKLDCQHATTYDVRTGC
ncbi:MAG: hypothetical protein JW724_02305 [Candidatus Altiarchaeota archaeon]|nr:hypothetical protein [Candidatus Altiarchaeota archaeon]